MSLPESERKNSNSDLTDYENRCSEFVRNVDALRVGLIMETDTMIERYVESDFKSTLERTVYGIEEKSYHEAAEGLTRQKRLRHQAKRGRMFSIVAGITGMTLLGVGVFTGFRAVMDQSFHGLLVAVSLATVGLLFAADYVWLNRKTKEAVIE